MKNRLVGILVVSALAIIFLPMILDGSGVRKDDFEVVIPPQPLLEADQDFETRVIELNAQVDAIPEQEQNFVDEASGDNPVKAVEKTEEKVEAQPPPEPQETPEVAAVTETPAAEKTGGTSWVLQVGSFQDRNKALAQRDRLRKSNIASVFIEQFSIDNKTSYRVRLGPFVNREQTRVAQNKIKAKHDINGIIMKYER